MEFCRDIIYCKYIARCEIGFEKQYDNDTLFSKSLQIEEMIYGPAKRCENFSGATPLYSYVIISGIV